MLRSGAVSSQEAVLCDVDGPWQAGGVCGLGKGIPEVCAETDGEPRGEDTDGTERVVT